MSNRKSSLLSNKTSRAVTIVALVVLLVVGGYAGYRRFTASRVIGSQSSLQTTKASKGDLVLYATGTGTIMPESESSFGFNTGGQVSSIDVKVGDEVAAGQVLAQLDDSEARIHLTEAQAAMNELISAQAAATARQTLANAETELASAKEALEFLISPEVLYWEEQVAQRQQLLTDAQTTTQTDTSQAAVQKVTQAEASLTFAQDELKYFQTVYEETYIPKNFTQYRIRTFRGQTSTEVIKVEDEETGKMVDLIYPPTEGETGMARARYDLAKAAVAEAQTYLSVLNGAEIPDGATGSNLVKYIQTRHTLETAKYNLQATRLVAPFQGTVTALEMNVGDLVEGTSIVTISNLDQPYALDAYLDANDWGQVRVGYAIEASFDIVPDRTFSGVVTDMYPTLDTTSSNTELIHIHARLNDEIPYQLPAGAAAAVDVIGGRVTGAVLVPVEALHEFEEGKYSLFVMENGRLRLRVVQVGLQDLAHAEIISGLQAGDTVTTGVVETR